MNVCHNCGTDNKPLYKFCIKCGGDLPASSGGGLGQSPMAMPDDRAFLDALADVTTPPMGTVPPKAEPAKTPEPSETPAPEPVKGPELSEARSPEPAQAPEPEHESPPAPTETKREMDAVAPDEATGTSELPPQYELPDLSQLDAHEVAPLAATNTVHSPAPFEFQPSADVTSRLGDLPVPPRSAELNEPPPTGAGALAGSRPCPNCGHMVPNDFAFCGQCGARLDDTTDSNAAPAATAPPPTSAQSGPRGRLVLVRPDGSEGGAHPLEEGENLIGRGVGALFDTDGYLSPRHADLVLNAAGLVVRDNASLNGVFARLVGEEELNDGDIFRIGQELMRFDAIRAPEPLEDGTEVLGSPNPGYWGRLAVVVGPGQDGSAFPLFGDAIVLGREHGDIIFPEDGYVSGTHARVAYRDDRYYLADMNSSNGTFLRVRGERIVPSGTFLLMGQQLFRVVY